MDTQDLINIGADENWTFLVICDGEVDYHGKNGHEAYDAVMAVDADTYVYFQNDDGSTDSYARVILDEIIDHSLTGRIGEIMNDD